MKNKKILLLVSLIILIFTVVTILMANKFKVEVIEQDLTEFISSKEGVVYYSTLSRNGNLSVKKTDTFGNVTEIFTQNNIYTLNSLSWSEDMETGAISVDIIPENGLMINEEEVEIPPRKIIIFKSGRKLLEKEASTTSLQIVSDSLVVYNPVEEFGDSISGNFEKINIKTLLSEKIADYESFSLILRKGANSSILFYPDYSDKKPGNIEVKQLNLMTGKIETVIKVEDLIDIMYLENTGYLLTKQTELNKFSTYIFSGGGKEDFLLNDSINETISKFDNKLYGIQFMQSPGSDTVQKLLPKKKSLKTSTPLKNCTSFKIVDSRSAFAVCDQKLLSIKGNLTRLY